MILSLPLAAGVLLFFSRNVVGNVWDDSFETQLHDDLAETWAHSIKSPDKFLLHPNDEVVYIDETDRPKLHAAVATTTTAPQTVSADKFWDLSHEGELQDESREDDESRYEKGDDYDVDTDEDEITDKDIEEYYSTKTFCSNDPTPTPEPERFSDIPKGPQDLHVPTLKTKVGLSVTTEHLDHASAQYVELLEDIGVENIVKGAWGITYSFYRPEGGCKSPEEIHADISKLDDFEVIRIYDTDCEGVLNVMELMKPYQKLYAGIYYLDRVDISVEIIAQAVSITGGDWSKVHTVSIGNELVNFGRATTLEVAALVERGKAILQSKGYKGYVVTTDTLVAMLNNKELCHIGDYVSVNSHPYWDGYVHPQDSGPWLVQQLDMLKDVCGATTPIVLCETGWPTRGQVFGQKGVPSKLNQLVALKSIVDTLGFKTILFTSHNDYWKADGSHGVEKFWGILE